MQDFVDRVQKHWLFIVIAGVLVVVSSTWEVADKVSIAPRDRQIAEMQKQIDDLKSRPTTTTAVGIVDPIVLHETGVFKGSAVTTNDGNCQIRVDDIFLNYVDISVIVGSDKPQVFTLLHTGDRVTVKSKSAGYFVDIHKIRGDIVDLSVSRNPQ